jgi:hyperosmotically inducible protein
VVLRGKVDSDEARRAAEGITAGLDGVKTVKHELQIVAPSIRDAVEEKDEAIAARVKAHFTKDAHLKNADMDVQTNAGVASLMGEVRNLMTSAQASWAAWQVPGVKAVKNDLTVKEKS